MTPMRWGILAFLAAESIAYGVLWASTGVAAFGWACGFAAGVLVSLCIFAAAERVR